MLPRHNYAYLREMVFIMKRKGKITYNLTTGLTDDLRKQVAIKGIRPEHIRAFIANYNKGQERKTIRSDDWMALRSLLEAAPSLQVVGDVGAGKTYLTKLLIRNDKKHIYIVLDAHNEYPELPEANNITPDLKQSCRIRLPDQPMGALGMFQVYYNIVTNNRFPENYVFVVDEALRYKSVGIKNLLAESRKFLKILAISQEKLVGFCPYIVVEPYNQS